MTITSDRKPIVIDRINIDFEYITYEYIKGFLPWFMKEFPKEMLAIKPFLDIVLSYEERNFPRLEFANKMMFILFKQDRVNKDNVQQGDAVDWHVDIVHPIPAKIVRQYLFATCYPTEFLLQETRLDSPYFKERPNGRIWSPKPYEIILARNNLHRSTKVKEECDRTLIRLSVTETP